MWRFDADVLQVDAKKSQINSPNHKFYPNLQVSQLWKVRFRTIIEVGPLQQKGTASHIRPRVHASRQERAR